MEEKSVQTESLKKSVNVFAIFCIAGLAVNILLKYLLKIFGVYENYTLSNLSDIAVSIISMLGISLICAKFCGGMKFCISKYQKKTGHLDNFLLAVLGFSGCVTISHIVGFISDIVYTIFPYQVDDSGAALSVNTDIYSVFLMMLSVAVVPAICEEFAFRGFAMGSLSDFGQGLAVLFSSILFGMMHNGFLGILFALLAGLLFACIRKTSGSLIPAMIVHILNNAYSHSILLFVSAFGIDLYATVSTVFTYCMIALFIVMLIVVHKRKTGFFTFESNNCVLTKSEKTKTVFSTPLLWIFVVFVIVANFLR